MNDIFLSTITREDILKLPLKQFNGQIVLVDTPASLKKSIKMIKNSKLLGFDTETKPSFKKGHSNKVSLLQLADENTCFIFRLNKIGLSDEIIHLLSDESLIKVGLSLRDDYRELFKLRQFQPEGFVELQKYVEDFDIQDKSLKKLAALILGIRISKSQQTSNWEALHLSGPQLIYAATDAWICYKIYLQLQRAEIVHERDY